MPSIKSLQTSGDKPPPALPIESRSGSRASSRHADNGGSGSVRPRSAASRPQSSMNATPKSVGDARSPRSRPPRATQTPTCHPSLSQTEGHWSTEVQGHGSICLMVMGHIFLLPVGLVQLLAARNQIRIITIESLASESRKRGKHIVIEVNNISVLYWILRVFDVSVACSSLYSSSCKCFNNSLKK